MSKNPASDRLHENDVDNFREALELYKEALLAERRDVEPELIDQAMSDARRALAIYQEEIDGAERRAVARLREAGLEDFAQALEAGEYSELAI